MPKNPSSNESYKPLSERDWALLFFICAGVILPLITLVVELSGGLCARELFNPIPTLWHVLLVLSVPVANRYLVWKLFKNDMERPTLLAWTSSKQSG